jgi:hypothetical protein
MAQRRFTVSLPSSVADAIHGEALRTAETPAVVVARVLSESLPDYVSRHLACDLEVDTARAAPPEDAGTA